MVSVIVLNWNTDGVVKCSVQELMKEAVEIIVIDNGSDEPDWEAWRAIHNYDKKLFSFQIVQLPRNYGSSRARNVGIELARGSEIFLLDGDILYVPGTISEYLRIMQKTGAVCVGQHNPEHVKLRGYNGLRESTLADKQCPAITSVYQGVPMAWTQYGLFKGDVLRKLRFPTHGAFGEPGHGFEDDWLYNDICASQDGYAIPLILSVEEPTYYHDAHSSMRELKKKNIETRTEERGRLFRKRWKGCHWSEFPKSGIIRFDV